MRIENTEKSARKEIQINSERDQDHTRTMNQANTRRKIRLTQ